MDYILKLVCQRHSAAHDRVCRIGCRDHKDIGFARGMQLLHNVHAGSGLTFKGQAMAAPRLFKAQEFNFENLGIGGLDQQFDQIFRRAFASRVFPPSMVERLGIRHVKGVLLFGPPGTGEGDASVCHCAPPMPRSMLSPLEDLTADGKAGNWWSV